MKIKIMIDSGADITLAEEIDKGIAVARFPLTINGEEYFEEIDITLSEFKEHLYNEAQISTSQAPLGKLIGMWDEFLEEYDEVIYLTLSQKLSGSYQSATAASREYNGRVTVLDGSLIANPIQITYDAMVRMVEEGKTTAEIKEIVENHEQMFAYIIPYDINHLKRGGRVSPQAAALASLLKIVPILKFDENGIDAHDKVRTAKKAVDKAVNELIAKYENPENYHWYILQSDLEDTAAEYKQIIESKINQEVIVRDFHPIILTHVGPKTFAVGVIRKYN